MTSSALMLRMFPHRLAVAAGKTVDIQGGTLFGAFVLIAHAAEGSDAKADLPNPEILLVVLTAGISVAAGAVGGRRRGRSG